MDEEDDDDDQPQRHAEQPQAKTSKHGALLSVAAEDVGEDGAIVTMAATH